MDIVFGLTLCFLAHKSSNVPHDNKWGGAAMRILAGLGKLLATLFWCVVLINLISPYAQPFAQLLTLAGAVVLCLHLAELVLFNALLGAQPRAAVERAKVLLFGMFHVWSLPAAEALAEAVPTNAEEAAPCAS
ncbi:DUF1145 domain-containing protein [Pseudomonas sp. OHS18]|uniref:DUF1145 domain-containing protein n=1 Tax=Pseudomonas sp. OHS18 TaxID=3399679 RepID=UPI003A869CB1